jgi:predicted RNA binding protein YcfA (HicA-like mRNA interferase family)
MSGKDMVRQLKKLGWTIDRIEGSHHIMVKNGVFVVVPVHANKDLKTGTLDSIKKKAGLK